MRSFGPFEGEVFKNGWRQAYPALALEKHGSLYFQVSGFDSDWLPCRRRRVLPLTRSVRGGMKIETMTPILFRPTPAFPTPSGLTTALFDERVRPPGAALRFVPAGWKSRYMTLYAKTCSLSRTGEACLQRHELQCGERQVLDRPIVVEEDQTVLFALG